METPSDPRMSEDERNFVITFTKRHEEMISELRQAYQTLQTEVGGLCVETQSSIDDVSCEMEGFRELKSQLDALTKHFYRQEKEIGRLRMLVDKPDVIEIESDTAESAAESDAAAESDTAESAAESADAESDAAESAAESDAEESDAAESAAESDAAESAAESDAEEPLIKKRKL